MVTSSSGAETRSSTWALPTARMAVTVLAVASKPRVVCSGGYGLPASFSAMHQLYFPGCPCVAMSPLTGMPRPTFRGTSRRARPR